MLPLGKEGSRTVWPEAHSACRVVPDTRWTGTGEQFEIREEEKGKAEGGHEKWEGGKGEPDVRHLGTRTRKKGPAADKHGEGRMALSAV